jgi:Core-2/I-Branching enzyme
MTRLTPIDGASLAEPPAQERRGWAGQDPYGGAPSLACVVLAHNDPVQVRRLIAALDPFPVFLHCDRNTPDEVFAAMTADLPDRCVLLDRLPTGWAKWDAVAAELAGYRAALAATDATHVALLSGADYPLAATTEISAFLAQHRGRSIALYLPMPQRRWGRSGGFARLRYRHLAWRKHMLRLPIPRRLPAGVVPVGGSAYKVLARCHAQAVVDVADSRPHLVRFWRWSWSADETFVGTLLNSPKLVPGWAAEHVDADLWWIGWGGQRRKSPPWLDLAYLDRLAAARAGGPDGVPQLFARKFSSVGGTPLLDAIDRSLRACAGVDT